MRRAVSLAVFGVFAAAACAAAAHSWSPGYVVGTIADVDPACVNDLCTARVRAERMGAFGGVAGLVPVSVHAGEAAFDARTHAPWSSSRAAFGALAVGDRVLLRGLVDTDNKGQPFLFAGHLARIAAEPPAAGSDLFPRCGPPPWSAARLTGCYDERAPERRVVALATLVADASSSQASAEAPSTLVLEVASARGDGVALRPSAAFDVATLAPGAAFLGSTVHRPRFGSLRAGDRVRLDGAYVQRPSCRDADACWPHLVVRVLTLTP